MKPIATDIYTFSNLIERKCLYVDKTGILLPFFGETGGKQFFFPRPLTAGAKRPPEWDEILRENADDVCTFPYAI